ncbi:MAG: assimilatory sulfite reductase (NADPH) flavoprotein subunit [Gammaproteobacteria bacterium]|nr:MAG: assimilatory sulfite reductase (NADPH) flavoprotein subunit [Gammaproteobacteria bacterium]
MYKTVTLINNYGLQFAEPELLEKIIKLPDHELNWLSGFCAGLAKSKLNPQQSIQLPEQGSVAKVIVLYASQSGNAQLIAETLQLKLGEANITADLKSCEQIKLKQLKDYSLLFIIAATHGEGEAPDNSIDFLELLHSKKAPALAQLQHAVLALGDSSYEFFCQTGKDFEQALLNLNSTKLFQRTDCDVDFEEQADQWIKDVVSKLETMDLGNKQTLTTSNSNVASTSLQPKMAYDKKHPYMASVLTVQKITGAGSIKDTYHVELSIENSGFQYSAGDFIGIWAINQAQLVSQILQHAKVDADQTVSFKDDVYNIADLLSTKLELTQLNKKLLVAYNDIAENKQLTSILENNVQQYIEKHQFIDLFIDFPTTLNVEQLIALLSPLKPRLYSIASSQQEAEDEIHLTINAVSESNANGIRNGLASNYLIHQLKENEQVAIYIDTNPNFKLPDHDNNIILIGPGTGIAPFRSFLQERDSLKAKGKNWIFFGNPNFNTDFLYQAEFKKYLTSGLLTRIDLAFSRDQQNKIYVQDKLLENSAQLWHWLDVEQASIYVCGDIKRMAKDVEKTLLTVIQNEGGKTEVEAKGYLKYLRKNKRYQRDVY